MARKLFNVIEFKVEFLKKCSNSEHPHWRRMHFVESKQRRHEIGTVIIIKEYYFRFSSMLYINV